MREPHYLKKPSMSSSERKRMNSYTDTHWLFPRSVAKYKVTAMVRFPNFFGKGDTHFTGYVLWWNSPSCTVNLENIFIFYQLLPFEKRILLNETISTLYLSNAEAILLFDLLDENHSLGASFFFQEFSLYGSLSWSVVFPWNNFLSIFIIGFDKKGRAMRCQADYKRAFFTASSHFTMFRLKKQNSFWIG